MSTPDEPASAKEDPALAKGEPAADDARGSLVKGYSDPPFDLGILTQLREEVAKIRHSLRTPLNQIIGYSEMLIESADEMKIGELVSDLRRIHNAGGELLADINDALASWKIDVGQIDITRMEEDMRTPLNAIIGYTELCHDQAVACGLTEAASDLGNILAAARNLSGVFEKEVMPLAPQFAEAAKVGLSALSQKVFPLKPLAPAPQGYTVASTPPMARGRILVVDDDRMNRDMLGRRLTKLGHEVSEAAEGHAALRLLKEGRFDLVLLDVMMPGLDGFRTLEFMKADPRLHHIPVVMLTALDDPASIVRCIEAGAEDYVPKPFNAVVLRARIEASLEKNRLREKEHAHLVEIQNERAKSDRLLLNVMPQAIADRLKAGEHTIVESFIDATIVFADIVGFSHIASRQSPQRTAQLLNEIFSNFDRITDQFKLEKIKTIGDAYMLVGGVPVMREDHATACAEAAFEMLDSMRAFNRRHQVEWSIRIGMNSGPVVAGIIGTRKFSYDLWGETVNIASRMESHGRPGRIQVSEATKELLGDRYEYDAMGSIAIKNAGDLSTYLLKAKPKA